MQAVSDRWLPILAEERQLLTGRSDSCTVTTEHQDLSQTRRFFNQPNIAPTNTSSIINRISRTADLHSTIKHSVPAYLNPRGYLPTMKQGSTRSPFEYQPNPVKLPTPFNLSNKVQPNPSTLRPHSSVLRQAFILRRKDKRIQPNPAKTTKKTRSVLSYSGFRSCLKKRQKGFNRIQQKQLRRLVWFFSILDCGSVSFSYIYLGN
jgi:hypothetical protein